MSLNKQIEEFLLERGAVRVAFTTVENLEGGPPSADLRYMLPEARSAISFALPLNRDHIRNHLGKKDYTAQEKDHIDTTMKSAKLSKELAIWLAEKGFKSARVYGNSSYRKDVPGWQLVMNPDLSHRYVAVRSGLGSFGWSGNVGITGYGTAIILGTVVTAAELDPTPPIPPEKSFCDKCKTCVSSCPSGMVDKKKDAGVTLGGVTFTFGARKDYTLCHIVCGGFTGLHKSGKWSSWSPGRYSIPEDAEELMKTFYRSIGNYGKWPKRPQAGGYKDPKLDGQTIRLTCGQCQIVCWGNKQDNRENYRLLTSSGCVIQREDGAMQVLPPDEAKAAFENMKPEHRELYE